jgi:hypothetical protein
LAFAGLFVGGTERFDVRRRFVSPSVPLNRSSRAAVSEKSREAPLKRRSDAV